MRSSTASPPAAARATLTPLEAATTAWRMANWRERSHADRCKKLARGQRCLICLELEAAQNRACEAVSQARLLAGRVS